MFADTLILASDLTDLITWQERLLIPFQNHAPQLAASVLVGAVLGMLGCFVILRRMALIGDAISHAVLPGVVIAFLLVSTGITGLFIGALLAGVLTAVGINLLTRYSRVKEDAAIGIVFTAMFAVGIILISRLPAGTHFDMKCFLFGDPLAVQREDLITISVVAPLVVATVCLLFHPLKLLSFDPVMCRTLGFNPVMLHYVLMILLSATIVAALRSVGVIMGVAMLITPAAVAYQLTNRLWTMLLVAAAAGATSALVGMFLAFQINSPPGPAMVLVATVMFLTAMAFAPERGLLVAWRRRRRIRAHIVEEDVLKALLRREQTQALAPAAASGPVFESAPAPALAPGRAPVAHPADLYHALRDVASAEINRAVRLLQREGLLATPAADTIAPAPASPVATRGAAHSVQPVLTRQGRTRALELQRSHRLWESYLAEHDVGDAHLHAEAERLEHAHSLADELADSLGNPATDPHGEPIPGGGG